MTCETASIVIDVQAAWMGINAQEHFLLVTLGHGLAHAFAQRRQRNAVAVIADEDALVAAVGRRHRHVEPLFGQLRGPRRHREVHFDALLQHGRRHHEHDEQHEHHVHERDHVDLGERGRDPPPA
jgi:hypothetical protein